jgi:hypothetical protein
MTPPDTPSWTDANSSDPGIAILELLAYLADSLGYRQDAVQAEKQRRTVMVAAVAGAIAAALACWWALRAPRG